jgi:membrane associated rhomboid family serine protease
VIPLSVDVPMRRLPWANWALMAVTVVTSIVGFQVLAHATETHHWPAALLWRSHFHAYQLVTHAFLHADWWHLGGNMLFLFLFGNAVDAKLGHLRFLGLYLLFAVLAGAGWLLLGPDKPALGASGAVMGLCGMYLVLYPRNNVTVWIDEVFPFIPLWITEISGVWVVLAFFAWDVLGVVWPGDEPVAFVAHLAGGLAGFGVASWLVWGGWVRAGKGEENLFQWFGYLPQNPRREDV